jgi:hypothetical protein
MTLAAPRSRQGKTFLVLAIFAAVAATLGAFLWANSAQATFPSSTATISAQPGGSVSAGQTVSYTFELTITAGTTTGTDVDFRVTLPAGSVNPHVTAAGAGWTAATCDTAISDGDLVLDECQSAAAVGVGTYDFTVTFQASGSAIPAFSASFVDSDTSTLTTPLTAGSTVAAGATVTDATNPPGAAHTFVFNMLAGWTCGSDPAEDVTRVCTSADVVLGGTNTCTAAPPAVGDAVMANPSTVSVTITPTTGTTGTCTVGLNIKFQGDPATLTDNCCASTVTATKTFAVVAGSLCHLDLPDAATENAAGNTNGILFVGNNSANHCRQDDIDDATGSFHAACLEGSSLTFAANNAQITWTITAVNGGPVAQSQTSFAGPGPNGVDPCVMWAAGGTGTQNITATYSNGLFSETFYWNGNCSAGVCTLNPAAGGPQPLIKEWNTINFTKIIGATGNVGDTLTDNTLELGNWVARDCVDSVGFCGRANLNGTTKDISGVLMPNGTTVSANGASFIDYTMGSHNDAGGAYDGPVDGAQQTYTISGDCGSVRLENPTQGGVIILSNTDGKGTYNAGPLPGPYAAPANPYISAVVNSSDKGVGFQVVPNDSGAFVTTANNGDCQPDSCVTVTIDTQEAGLFHSPPLITASQETTTVCFHVGPPTNKQPLLAWAGQRIVLEHDWSFTDVNGNRSCPFGTGEFGTGPFFVRYVKESGNGALISDLGNGAASGPDFMVVRVFPNGDSNVDATDNCISRVIYESQDQGEQDVVAHVVECAPVFRGVSAQPDGFGGSVDPDTCTVVSQQVAFLAFYMKFEDITLKLLPDATTHGSPPAQSSTAVSPAAGADSTTANVSENVLARATVRGWVLADNCPARASSVGSNGEFIPANRCIFPDDWLFKAGGATALEARPNYDIYGGSTSPCTEAVAGPFSQLDAPGCGGTQAPHAGGGQRETNFPDGVINANDAPMPSALMRFGLTGSGFLLGAAKHNPNSQFDVTHIPAEPWITPINSDGSGYQWNSWGTGAKSGVYHYWTDFASHGPEVLSCAGASDGAFVFVPGVGSDPCGDGSGVATGGFDVTKVYSDEHGNAMTWINGDANLSFTGCSTSAPVSGTATPIVLLKGFYCKSGATVGTSTLNALVDYPDKRKHFAIESGNVTVTWTWGGIKDVTVVPDPKDATGQFHYVVFHVTDRDGFCGESSSLHPVLGEEVDFRIDSTTGVILPDINGNTAEGPAATVSADLKSATTHTFDTSANPTITIGAPAADECQAWIHVSESQLKPVNVVVTAFDPEGTVTFDTQAINPTPAPTAVPPTATPFTLHLKWGNTDCSQDGVTSRDAQAILKRVLEKTLLSVDEPCPSIGQMVIVAGNTQHWGNWDCSTDGVTSRDAQAVLKFVLQKTALSQTAPCPAVGSDVDVQPITIP